MVTVLIALGSDYFGSKEVRTDYAFHIRKISRADRVKLGKNKTRAK
jgi:hypothetical protein